MARKVIQLQAEQAKIREKEAEIERLAQEAEQEEKNLLETTTNQITELSENSGLFCGVILSKQDLVAIIELALRTNEAVKIPFRLYFKE